jgi:hypothetical protein
LLIAPSFLVFSHTRIRGGIVGSWIFFLNSFCEGGSSSGGGGGGSHSNAGPGEGKDVVELTEANFRKKVINSDKVSLSQLYAKSSVLQIRDPTKTK